MFTQLTKYIIHAISFLSRRAQRENMAIHSQNEKKGWNKNSKVRQCCNHNGTKLTKVHKNNTTKTQQKQQKQVQCHNISYITKVCSPCNLKKTIKGCYAWANPEVGSRPPPLPPPEYHKWL